MSESIAKISVDELQKVTYQFTSPLQLDYSGQAILCKQLIRIVPGKRLVFLGSFGNDITGNNISDHDVSGKDVSVDKIFSHETVIIKLFVHSSRAQKHWSRECAGAKLLSDNNIPTAKIIAQGVSEEGIYFLIFRYIEGQNLAAFWKENNQADREKKLKKLMPVLERHHRSGLAHQDLHYGNFLLDKQGNVYTLDGEEIKASSAPLNHHRRLKNLALFLAQTFDLSKSSSLSLLNDYAHLASLHLNVQESEQFWQWIKHYHQERIEQYLKKILRECTDVIVEKQQHGYTFCRREYHNSNIQQLLVQPELFFQNKRSVYLKQGNTCTVKSVLVDDERYVIKRYNPKGIAYEIKHKGQMSRARKSWINAHLLQFMGILTPEPVALIEQHPAIGKRCSYFISKYTEGQSSWNFFCDKDNSEKDKQFAADRLIKTLRQLSEYKITHGDLKGSNFLIHKNRIWMLDLDAMTQHKTTWLFRKSWRRDKQRFLKNWEKKACYEPWKIFFNNALSGK